MEQASFSPAVDLRDPPELIRIGRGRVPGGARNRYTLDSTWAIHLYYKEAWFRVCGAEFHISPGSVTVTPRGMTSEYRAPRALDHLFVHFSLDESRDRTAQLPLHVPPSEIAREIARTLQRALVRARDETRWAEAELWTALHALASAGRIRASTAGAGGAQDSSGNEETHPSLKAALDFVELNLPNPISLHDLATAAGVSATHLNRLFAGKIGTSAMTYLRERRMDLARYLLIGTSIPVKEIAYQVGIADVHAFNKLCKRYLGLAPSKFRDSAGRRAGTTGRAPASRDAASASSQ